MKSEKVSYSVWIIVSLYLLYTAYSLMKNVIGGGSENPVLFTIASVIFGVFAVVFIISGVKGIMRLNQEAQLNEAQVNEAQLDEFQVDESQEEKTVEEETIEEEEL